MKTDWVAYAAIAVLVLIWGGTFAMTRVALEGFPPMAVASGRLVLAALIVVTVAISTGHGLPKTREHWLWTGMLGMINFALPFSLIAWGQLEVPSSITATYISVVPLFVLLFSWLILRETVSPRKWVGFAVGFAGLIWLAHPWEVISLGGSLLPHGAILIATAGMALGSVIIRKMPDLHPLTGVAAAFIVASIASLPFGAGALMHTDYTLRPVIGLLLLGVFSTGIAQVLRFFTVKRTSAIFVSIVGYLIPIWAGILGIWLLNETISTNAIIAYALIIIGLLIARDRRKGSTLN